MSRPGGHRIGAHHTILLRRLAVVVALTFTPGCTVTADTDFDAGASYAANCMSCHGGAAGGTISDLPPVHNANGHTWHHGDCVIAEIIRDGSGPRPGLPTDVPTMPAFDQLTDDQVDALIDHLRDWWTPEQRQAQRQTTARACS